MMTIDLEADLNSEDDEGQVHFVGVANEEPEAAALLARRAASSG